MEGNVEHAALTYIIRDHDAARFDARKAYVQRTAEWLEAKYGKGSVKATVTDQYRNMREQVEPVMHIIDIALEAMQAADVTPAVRAIRGGTDGAQLSFMGLPCPNIFAGGLNFHGRLEFVPLESIEKASEVIRNIIALFEAEL